ncbi:jg1749 [Pararge aegeria aegeria]|uniref:Jg1749 protein n=1 Tax=Pararge aegeria aegeria TaxID=348720 RepID=A0A8S4SJ73_9NEOP|nr:jg1749 [Pararge aegeria aegeria]
MDESGIDMGYDLASLLTNDFNIDQKILDEMTTAQHQDFMFYELKSKAVPVTESVGCICVKMMFTIGIR